MARKITLWLAGIAGLLLLLELLFRVLPVLVIGTSAISVLVASYYSEVAADLGHSGSDKRRCFV